MQLELMTQDTVSDIAKLSEEFATTPTEELVASLVHEMRVTVDRVIRIAAIVRTLEGRGVDLTDLKLSMLDHIRRVAHGHLMPQVIVQFQERPLLLEKVAALPVVSQRDLLNADSVDVAAIDKAGRVTTTRKNVPDLAGREVHQVFFRGKIRSQSEQVAWLNEQRRLRAQVRKKGRPAKPKAVVDRDRGGLVVGNVFISKKDLARYLAELQ